MQASGLTAIGLSFGQSALARDNQDAEQSLTLYNWDTYIGETTLEDFKEISGIHVEQLLFETNDELLRKMRASPSRYDVIVPSHDFAERMIKEKLLYPLESSLIPNLSNIDPVFRNPSYDPHNRFTVPYTFLALGVGYRKSKVGNIENSWKSVLDDDRFKGRVGWMSDADAMFRLYAKYLGIPLNGLTATDIELIEQKMQASRGNVKLFHDDDGQDLLLKGKIDLAIEYNGDMANAISEDSDLGFFIPYEGTALTVDTLCIPVNAPNPLLAHNFINFMLSADAGRKVTETILYPTPNAAARAVLPDEIKNDSVISGRSVDFEKSEYPRYLPEVAELVAEAYKRVRSR
ncbi:PotD/PotF family extracellular solute-binding protein [uncultured Sphingorhabdus sp.]|uniref:ABC transporter substrate-binding protein n=1 Tax=uncultured Sphingorhabdus sp. TaxID=1686106 RepID=UPI0026333F3F|nr:spermidine/putrescine ABC transporter substrate-binding protein [uncultured Sphingorhabdus sp.]